MPVVPPPRVRALLLCLAFCAAPGVAYSQPPVPVSTIKIVSKPAPKPVAAGPRPPTAPAAPLPKVTAVPRAPRLIPVAQASTAAGSTRVLPWVTLAGSLAAGVAGSVFMGKSLSAVNRDVDIVVKNNGDGTSTVSLPEAYRQQQREVLTNGVIGTVLLSTAIAGSVASIISLASD